MNGSGEKRYLASHEKVSKKLRLMFPCYLCGENDFKKKETHHIDGNKKNGSIDNLVVLCQNCHRRVHLEKISLTSPSYNISGYSVTVACDTSSIKDWFNSRIPLKILPNLHPSIALKFRKDNIKGFVSIGGCNYYIGLSYDGVLIGVLGFSVPDYGDYDLLLKADTTLSELNHSTDLLLYILRTKIVQKLLEDKFNRKINTVYSMCFSKHRVISRYRKHAKKIQEKQKKGGYDLGYLFDLGGISSVKEAKSLFMQNLNKNAK